MKRPVQQKRQVPTSLAIRMYLNGAVQLAIVMLSVGLGLMKWDRPLWFGMSLAGIGGLFIIWGLLHGHRQVAVLQIGKETIGTIERIQAKMTDEGGTFYILTCCFYVPDGKELSLYGRKYLRTFQSNEAYTELTVLYHPHQPRHAIFLPIELVAGAEIYDDLVLDTAPARTYWHLILPVLMLGELVVLHFIPWPI
jgi:hypothetical protein